MEPLGRALAGLEAWVTGLRHEQSVTRTDTPAIEIDDAHGGIVKLNPLVRWSTAEVRSYAETHKVPIHPLHDRGYPSIGCAPCTRAIKPGEHPRAGRWWWEESREQGVRDPHRRRSEVGLNGATSGAGCGSAISRQSRFLDQDDPHDTVAPV